MTQHTGPGQVGPEKTLGWPLAEGKAQPDPPSLTVLPSVAPLFYGPVGYSTRNLPAEAGASLTGPSQGLPEVATEGCGFLPGQVGLWPVGKPKVELILPHPPVIALVSL